MREQAHLNPHGIGGELERPFVVVGTLGAGLKENGRATQDTDIAGFTNSQAVRVSEEIFVTVMESNIVHRLDGLSVEGNLVRAHCTWSVNDSDMGHVYDMTLNLTT